MHVLEVQERRREAGGSDGKGHWEKRVNTKEWYRWRQGVVVYIRRTDDVEQNQC